jgi:hypothetical protein
VIAPRTTNAARPALARVLMAWLNGNALPVRFAGQCTRKVVWIEPTCYDAD